MIRQARAEGPAVGPNRWINLANRVILSYPDCTGLPFLREWHSLFIVTHSGLHLHPPLATPIIDRFFGTHAWLDFHHNSCPASFFYDFFEFLTGVAENVPRFKGAGHPNGHFSLGQAGACRKEEKYGQDGKNHAYFHPRFRRCLLSLLLMILLFIPLRPPLSTLGPEAAAAKDKG